jgi:hypothetical protein
MIASLIPNLRSRRVRRDIRLLRAGLLAFSDCPIPNPGILCERWPIAEIPIPAPFQSLSRSLLDPWLV